MADIRSEAVARQEGVCLLPATARVGLTAEGRCAAFDEVERCGTVGVTTALFWIVGGRCSLASVSEDLSHDLVRNALAAELAPKCQRAAWTSTVPALHPGPSEIKVVEVADLDQPLEDPLDDGGRIAQVDQPLARLVHRARTHRQEGSCSLHHGLGLGDRSATSTPRLSCLTALLGRACSMGHLLGLFDALHGDVDLGDLGADMGLKLLRDVLVGAQELLRLLPALAEADFAVVEPGA